MLNNFQYSDAFVLPFECSPNSTKHHHHQHQRNKIFQYRYYLAGGITSKLFLCSIIALCVFVSAAGGSRSCCPTFDLLNEIAAAVDANISDVEKNRDSDCLTMNLMMFPLKKNDLEIHNLIKINEKNTPTKMLPLKKKKVI